MKPKTKLIGAALLASVVATAGVVQAQEPTFFRIGTVGWRRAAPNLAPG